MKKEILLLFSLILLISFVSASSCPLNIPVSYYGTVSYDGELLGGDYIIKAMLNHEISGLSEIIDGNYYLDVSPCYGITSGTISFVINGVEANEEANYDTENFGREIKLDLIVNSLPPLDDVCGNGVIEAGEECDDNNADDSDGCSSICEVEYNYVCTGQPSMCVEKQDPYCGDGSCNNGETCSSCPGDCGNCQTNDDNDDSPDGRNPSGDSPIIITSETTDNQTTNEEKTIGLNGNQEPTIPGITGGVIGFIKSGGGLAVIIFSVLIIVIGIGVIVIKKKHKTSKNE